MYGRRYENQYDLTRDYTYNTWKKYKDMLNESMRASEDSCITSLNTSDLGHETNINTEDSNVDLVINMLDFAADNESQSK